jgi:mevalonate kinase
LTLGVGRGSGLGKLILCGEHAVVYGYPALAMAIDLKTQVDVSPSTGATHVVGPTDPRLDEALRVAAPHRGLEIRIRSDIPMGRGMGSSAALAVAWVRALADAAGEPPLTHETVFARALPIERVFHGNPSGLDVATSARGGVLKFRRATPPLIEPAGTVPAVEIVALDSGSMGATSEIVAQVASLRPGIDPVLERIGALVERAGGALSDPAALGPLLTENHALLRELGVSTPALDDLVALALNAGALGAKLSGAGGGGVVLALATDATPLLRAAESRGIRAIRCHGAPS